MIFVDLQRIYFPFCSAMVVTVPTCYNNEQSRVLPLNLWQGDHAVIFSDW